MLFDRGLLLTLAIFYLMVAPVILVFQLQLIGPSSPVIVEGRIAFYWDAECTRNVTLIQWGSLQVATSKSVEMYVKNEGTFPVYLRLETRNWYPQNASDVLTLSWDYDGTVLNANATRRIVFTLTVSPATAGITSFSFEIHIETRAHQ